jgi:hypothetical protein
MPLLALLVALVAAYPLVEDSYTGRWLFNLVAVIGIVFSLRRIRVSPRGVGLAAVLGALALAMQLAHWGELVPHAGAVSAVAQAIFYFTAAALQAGYFLRDTRATVDELFSAAVAFLLLAFGWACVYWCVEYFVPGSFAVAAGGRPGWYELFYFSVTTLSTTGFGDVAPVTSAARSATLLEQLAGVLYVALVISRLVGFTGQRSGESAGD